MLAVEEFEWGAAAVFCAIGKEWFIVVGVEFEGVIGVVTGEFVELDELGVMAALSVETILFWVC